MRDNRRNKPRYNREYNKDYSEQNRGLALPSPALLESYEEISPGLADKLADLIKQEQKHRHEWENRYIKSMAGTAKIGQLFGLILCIVIIYATVLLAQSEHNTYLAAVVCLSGFGFLACSALASVKTKHIMRKPQYHKHNKRHSA